MTSSNNLHNSKCSDTQPFWVAVGRGMFRVILTVCVLIFGLKQNSQACEKIDDRTYVIAFDRTYSLDEVKVFDWVKGRCGHVFPERLPRGFVPSDLQVTILLEEIGSVDLSYFDANGRELKSLRWFPLTPYAKGEIRLDSGLAYSSVEFSRKMPVQGIQLYLVGL